MNRPELCSGQILETISSRELSGFQYGSLTLDPDEIRGMPMKGADIGRKTRSIEEHYVEHEIVPILGEHSRGPSKAGFQLPSDGATSHSDDWAPLIGVVDELDTFSGAGLHPDV